MIRTFAILALLTTAAAIAFFVQDARAQSSACEPGVALPEDASEGLISDCEALMASKSPLKGSSGSLNWWSGRAINRWNGVTVSNGRVTGLDLRNKGLNGTVPSRLTDLDQLDTLYLAGNSFTGCLPFDLIKVLRNDIASLGLPFCGGQTLPTPTPSPTPTPGPKVNLSDVVQFNCNTQDIRAVYGSGYELTSQGGPWTWDANGEGWIASYWSVWEKGDDTVICQTIQYINRHARILGVGRSELLDWYEDIYSSSGTVMGEFHDFHNLPDAKPQLGNEYYTTKVYRGYPGLGANDKAEITNRITLSVLGRGTFGVFVWDQVRDDKPEYRVYDLSRRIDSRIVGVYGVLADGDDDFRSVDVGADTRDIDVIDTQSRYADMHKTQTK